MNNIVSLLTDHASRQGDTIAIIQGKRKLRYRQLLSMVTIAAQKLQHKGIGKNDRVLMFIPMSIELFVFMLAVWYRGASAVFIDAWASMARIEQALSIVPCKAFIGSPKAHLLRLFSKAIRKITIHILADYSFSKDYSLHTIEPVETESDDTALVTFTTGSTGLPKAANRTHGFLLRQHQVLKNHIHPQEGDIECICLPVFVLNCLASGTTVFIPPINPARPHRINPGGIVKLLKKHACTTIIASPVFFEIVADYCIAKKIVPDIKNAFLGGAPVFVSSAKKIIKGFKNTLVEIVYGSTEAEPIAYIKAEDLCVHENKKESRVGLLVGKPSSDINVRIINFINGPVGKISEDVFKTLTRNTNETGEITVCGDHVLKEYLNCPDAQRENKFTVGNSIWHRTGDAGYIDSDGNLYLMGRVKNRIISNGKVVFQLAAELALSECEQIRIGTIIGIDNKVFCVVELHPNAVITNNEILNIVKQFDIDSEEFIIRTQIPRDPRHHSKIDYDRLRLIIEKNNQRRYR